MPVQYEPSPYEFQVITPPTPPPPPPPSPTREEIFREAPSLEVTPVAMTREGYFRSLADILNVAVNKGQMYPEDAQKFWANIDQYVKGRGLTPALPYYQRIQQQIKIQPSLDFYERGKASVLGANLTFTEKFEQLLSSHPQAGELKVNRQIREDVLASLSPDERKFLTTGQSTPAIFDFYKERWEADPRGLDWEGYYNQFAGLFEMPTAAADAAAAARYAPTRYAPTTYAPTAPAPRYEPAFEAERAALTGTPSWKDWFERSYSTLLRQYKGVEAEPTEVGWAEYLKRKKPELKEEWWGETEEERRWRTRAFQPMVRTVKF